MANFCKRCGWGQQSACLAQGDPPKCKTLDTSMHHGAGSKRCDHPADNLLPRHERCDKRGLLQSGGEFRHLHRCRHCPKWFLESADLTSHLRSHTSERPFPCDRCRAAFADKRTLTVHLRTHTGERPYRCEQCPKAFTQLSVLQRHRRLHTGERPFQCPACPTTFTAKHHLSYHLRTHTGERPYACELCARKFTTRSALTVHRKSERSRCFVDPSVFRTNEPLS